MKISSEIRKRVNVNTYRSNETDICIYQDHRYLLYIIFLLRKGEFIERSVDLIYYDYHDDYCPPPEEVKDISKDFRPESTSEREFWDIVEFTLNPLDDDWVKTGMELGLIGDAIVIGAEDIDADKGHDIYVDVKDRKHAFISIPHLSSSLGERGCIGDHVVKKEYYEKAREFFGIEGGYERVSLEMSSPVILDFDLDCFSSQIREKRVAWPRKMFKNEMRSRVGYLDISPLSFIHKIMSQAEIVTIAREEKSCGGIGEASVILNYLDRFIFDGALDTDPYR